MDTTFALEPKFDSLPPLRSSAVSAFVTVQEGCDRFCSFCVVPYTRGSEWSRPVQDVYDEVCQRVALGAKDVTLLGQNVNAYHGEDEKGQRCSLGRLIMRLADIDGLKRIRYTTSHPIDMHEELLAAHRDVKQLMPFVHLPVQSGSERILRAMNRRHDVSFYRRWIERLRRVRDDMAFSSDFIVGFPGEDEDDFQATLSLVRAMWVSAQSFSFCYSPRPGTPASLLALGCRAICGVRTSGTSASRLKRVMPCVS